MKTLVDINLMKEIIGCLMHNPELMLNPDMPLDIEDFSAKGIGDIHKIVYSHIYNMKTRKGINGEYDPFVVSTDIATEEIIGGMFNKEDGLNYCKQCYNTANLSNYEIKYSRLKKLTALRALQKAKYDISYYYNDNVWDIREEEKLNEHFEEASVEDIFDNIEGNLSMLRTKYTQSIARSGSAYDGVENLLREFKKHPDIGFEIEGELFSSAVRGARLGKYYVRSASSGVGKSRLAVFDACRLAYPQRWSNIKKKWIKDVDKDGNDREGFKTLVITTEMEVSEVQPLILAYLSGVNESIISNNEMTPEQEARVEIARQIMERNKDCLYIDEISDPNIENVKSAICRRILMNGVQYVFYDYIFTSPSLLNQFAKSGAREDVVLGMMSNMLKQVAKDYNVFVSTSTQLNADGMNQTGFKDEKCLRGSKALADKADVACILSRVDITSDEWLKKIKPAYDELLIHPNRHIKDMLVGRGLPQPNIIIDIYKMRKGEYKNVRIWSYIHLGTGERYDLFMTNSANMVIETDSLVFKYKYFEDKDWDLK